MRPIADRPGLPERARQCGPGDPGTRHDHDRDATGRADGGDRHRRHRPRDVPRRARLHLRSVLYHQARRGRYRPGSLHQLRDRHEASRGDPGREPRLRRSGVHPPPAGRPGRRARAGDADRMTPATVLLVDDEPRVLDSLEALLAIEHRVLRADRPESALEQLRAEDVAVVLSDQRMPGLTGTELLTRSRDVAPDTVRILLTAFTDTEALMDSINAAGVYHFLLKPWDPNELRHVVGRAVEHHRLCRERETLLGNLAAKNAELEQAVTHLRDAQDDLIREASVRSQLQRYVSPRLVDLAVANPGILELPGDWREATVLFADIRGFTRLIESTTAPVVIQLLNEYFTEMIDVIFRHQGTVEQLVGDEIVALFGVPEPGAGGALDRRRAAHLRHRDRHQLRSGAGGDDRLGPSARAHRGGPRDDRGVANAADDTPLRRAYHRGRGDLPPGESSRRRPRARPAAPQGHPPAPDAVRDLLPPGAGGRGPGLDVTAPASGSAADETTILIVDDEPRVLDALEAILAAEFRVLRAGHGEEALERLAAEPNVAVIVTDHRMPGMTGVELLRRCQERTPDAVRIVLTAYTDVDSLMEAINTGRIYHFVPKPWDPNELLVVVRRAAERWRLARENARLRDELELAYNALRREAAAGREKPASFDKLVGAETGLRRAVELARKVLDGDTSVLLLGETGTGKELFAHLIHANGSRRTRPFVAQSCGALPDTLLESELFGHARGAFTGAVGERKGL